MNKSLIFVASTLGIISVAGCASSRLERTAEVVDSPLADVGPHDYQSVKSALETAKEDNIHLISPRWYAGAMNTFKDAKPSETEELRKSRSLLNRAYSSALPIKDRMKPLLEARQGAINAGGVSHPKFADLEKDFLRMTADLDTEFRSRSIGQIPELTDRFRDLRTATLEKKLLGDAQIQIAIAKREGAGNLAPKSLEAAEEALKAAEEFIKQNPQNSQMLQELGNRATFEAERALAITRQVKEWEKLNREEIALKTEGLLGIVAAPTQLDLRNKAFEAQATELSARYQNARSEQARINEMSQQVSQLQNQASSLKKFEAASIKNQQFENVRKMFTEDEAQVYRQGDSILISLKTIEFPIGQSEIPSRSFPLLEKVNKAVDSFENPVVIVEGHTDSTGTDALNKQLSEERAEAVRKYLASVKTSQEQLQLSSVGYGSEKPLASNETKEGRAMNRRIDVVIKSAL